MEQDDKRSQSYKYQRLKSEIKDWGLSHPTLEEVFLRLTKEDEQKKVTKTIETETDTFNDDLASEHD